MTGDDRVPGRIRDAEVDVILDAAAMTGLPTRFVPVVEAGRHPRRSLSAFCHRTYRPKIAGHLARDAAGHRLAEAITRECLRRRRNAPSALYTGHAHFIAMVPEVCRVAGKAVYSALRSVSSRTVTSHGALGTHLVQIISSMVLSGYFIQSWPSL